MGRIRAGHQFRMPLNPVPERQLRLGNGLHDTVALRAHADPAGDSAGNKSVLKQ